MRTSQTSKEFKTFHLSIFGRSNWVRLFIAFGITMVLSACGDNPAGTAADREANITSTNNQAPNVGELKTNDSRKFKTEFYDPMMNYCGTCHGAGQSPEFLAANVAAAYSQAIQFVNIETYIDPVDSLEKHRSANDSIFLTKADEGHNCWITNQPTEQDNYDACEAQIKTYLDAWIGGSEGTSERDIVLVAPPIRDPGATRTFPEFATNGSPSFATSVHPLLVANCQSCHSETSATPQAPFFANDDAQTSYEAAKSKMNIDFELDGDGVITEESPLRQSRFIVRLRDEFHNCFSTDCDADADAMQAQILAFAQGIAVQAIDPTLIASKASNLVEATIASGGQRHESHTIALWEFSEGQGSIAYDTSGVPDPTNLNLSNVEWILGNGIDIKNGGFAQAYTQESRKLYDFIRASGEYSIEAWIIPANVTQENASIMSFTGGGGFRNFTMGQTMYNYDFINLSTDSDGNAITDGTDATKYMTDPDDENLQAALQHVVMTYDPVNGRKIFVNGVDTAVEDATEADANDPNVLGGLLNDWSTSFGLYLGREPGNSNTQWLGKIRLAAVHNRALTQEQITQNYEVGVGQKYFLLFSVAERLGTGYENSFIVFEVQQYDNYAYLFNQPKFVNLTEGWTPPAPITIKGMRIGVNSTEVVQGQAFGHMNVVVDDTSYTSADGQILSDLGTIIELQKGPAADEFFLTFEQLGGLTNNLVEDDPVLPTAPADPSEAVSSDIGVRTFDEINETMSLITGITKAVKVDLSQSPYSDANPVFNNQQQLNNTFTKYRQALPAISNIEAYLPSHQMAVAQLALNYCDVLVDTNPGGFYNATTLATAAETAFDAGNFSTNSSNVITPIVERVLNVNTSNSRTLLTQPNESVIENMLGSNVTQTLDAGVANTDYTSLVKCMTTCGVNGVGTPRCEIYWTDDNTNDVFDASEQNCDAADVTNQTGVARTLQVAKAVCASVLGSATMLIK